MHRCFVIKCICTNSASEVPVSSPKTFHDFPVLPDSGNVVLRFSFLPCWNHQVREARDVFDLRRPACEQFYPSYSTTAPSLALVGCLELAQILERMHLSVPPD
jgi:hypothetical protein